MGAGWRNVDVGALLSLRGVKCCCKVLKAGRGTFLGSSFVGTFGLVGAGARGRRPTLGPSGFVLTLADLLRPARRVDVRVIAGSGCIEPLLAWAAEVEGMCTDFGLSAVDLGLVVLLRASGTVLVD